MSSTDAFFDALSVDLTFRLAVFGEGPLLCGKRGTLPDLMFKVGHHEFNITAYDYIWNNEGWCSPLFWPIEPDGKEAVWDIRAKPRSQWTWPMASDMEEAVSIRLGTPFLKKWFTAYDFERRTISLAKAKSL